MAGLFQKKPQLSITGTISIPLFGVRVSVSVLIIILSPHFASLLLPLFYQIPTTKEHFDIKRAYLGLVTPLGDFYGGLA